MTVEGCTTHNYVCEKCKRCCDAFIPQEYRDGIISGLRIALDDMYKYYNKYSSEYSREDTGGALITIVEELIKQYSGE